MKSILFLLVIVLSIVSCRDSFTEEDALKAQQEVDLLLYVVDLSDPGRAPIANATVTINQGNQFTSGATNENGVILFQNVKVGGFVYQVEAVGFLTISGTEEIDPANFRISQEVVEVGSYSLTNTDNLATVKGRVTIETDLTNLTRENAASVPITLTTTVQDKSYTFRTETDDQGLYNIQLPIIEGTNGVYRLTVPDLEVDQTVAINKFANEEGDFLTEPQVLPRIEQISTVFSVFRTSLDPARSAVLENGVRSVYAIADIAPSGGRRAIIGGVDTGALGQVINLVFSDGGDYTNDADGVVRVEVIGLSGGSGAVFDIPLGGETDLRIAYLNALISGAIGFPIGTGYVPSLTRFNNNFFNVTQARAGSESLLFGDFIQLTLTRGQVLFQELDYGTGISRDVIIQ